MELIGKTKLTYKPKAYKNNCMLCGKLVESGDWVVARLFIRKQNGINGVISSKVWKFNHVNCERRVVSYDKYV